MAASVEYCRHDNSVYRCCTVLAVHRCACFLWHHAGFSEKKKNAKLEQNGEDLLLCGKFATCHSDCRVSSFGEELLSPVWVTDPPTRLVTPSSALPSTPGLKYLCFLSLDSSSHCKSMRRRLLRHTCMHPCTSLHMFSCFSLYTSTYLHSSLHSYLYLQTNSHT